MAVGALVSGEGDQLLGFLELRLHRVIHEAHPIDNCQQSDVRVVLAMTATVPRLFEPDMLADPNATYARIRGPVSWNEQLGLWLVTRHEDVRWALGDPRLSSTLATPADHPADGSAHLLADMYTLSSPAWSSPTRRTTRGCVGSSLRPSFLP